ncbi:unnamed protein product [Rhizoctonia solani]|uniref:Zn(2)-C6 fungal-type domain-containing protein n=1 Tax=Rhizoctonia solani TaxID=456999 RepID=A0A8H3EBN3_9AGAM|nr:unnamed protein product [Rhizoctonia solani]
MHHTGRPRCSPCVHHKSRCNRGLPACGSCTKYARACTYPGNRARTPDGTPEAPPTPAPRSPSRPAGMRYGRETPTAWGSFASSLTAAPSRDPSPAPAQPTLRHTQSLSSILGDKAPPPLNSKRSVRSPSPSLGIEIAARTERLRLLRAQLDTEAAELDQLATIANINVGILDGPHPGHAPNINPLGDPILPPRHANPRSSPSADPDDDVVPGFQSSGVIFITPDFVEQIMRKGWKIPFSIAMLRDDYCLASATRARKGKTITVGDEGDSLTLAASTESFDSSMPEDSLSYEQWVQAWRRLLALIRRYLSEALHLRWLKHYQYIDTRSDRSKYWKLWLRYDIAVRTATRADKRIDPASFQAQIFNDLLLQYTVDTSMSLAAQSQGTSSTAKSGPRLTKPSSTATLPQTSQGPNANGLCFRCGRESHAALTCSESKQISGRDILIRPAPALRLPARMAPISAPSAALTSTVPNLATDDLRRITTPLIPDAWEATLRQFDLWQQFHDIPDGLRYGFRIGTSHVLSTTSMPPNHKSSLDNAGIVTEAINKELSAGRYSGPFSPKHLERLIGPFRSAPLGVIAKSKPGEFRIVQDFSFPKGEGPHPALNAEIDSDSFTCEWGFFNNIVDIILACPPGTEAATLDVDAAYRRMPIHPDDQPHIVIMWDNQVWLDHCAPFGAASSNGIFGRCGDAMAHIAEAMGMGPVQKWVDDFVFFRFPPPLALDPPRFSLQDIYDLGSALGWPWKDEKTTPFSPSFTYLGLEWHIPERTVAIPLPKRDKYMARAHDWLASPKVTQNQTETLVGSLAHYLRLPANETVLCAFAAAHARMTAGGTAANRIAALKTYHAMVNSPWRGGPRLAYVLKGVTNLAPNSSKKPPRPPISADMIEFLHDNLNLDSPEDASTFAVASTKHFEPEFTNPGLSRATSLTKRIAGVAFTTNQDQPKERAEDRNYPAS